MRRSSSSSCSEGSPPSGSDPSSEARLRFPVPGVENKKSGSGSGSGSGSSGSELRGLGGADSTGD